MPRVIAHNAAAEDILADCATTLRRGRERGGAIGAEIERFLGPVMAESADVVAASAAADRADLLAREAVDVRTREVRLQVGAAYDELWNKLGRPRNDPRLSQWFPQAGRTGLSGPVEGMPVRIRIVVASIRKKPHPLLPEARCLELAADLASAADRLKAALDAAAGPAAEKQFYGQMVGAMARGAHTQLASLKRSLRAYGMTETRVHELIPASEGPRKRIEPPQGTVEEPVIEEAPVVEEPTLEEPAAVEEPVEEPVIVEEPVVEEVPVPDVPPVAPVRRAA